MLQEKRELAKQFSDRTNFESVPVVPEEAEVTNASPEGKGSLESGSNHTTLSRFPCPFHTTLSFSLGNWGRCHALMRLCEGKHCQVQG